MSKSVEDLLAEIDSQEQSPRGKQAVARAPSASPTRTASRSAGLTRIRESTMLLVVGAVFLIAVIGSIPYLSYGLYPFTLFVTLLHETSHALMGIFTGGTVSKIGISSDGSGATYISGGIQPLIAPAGYIGATVAGAAILLTPLRFSRWVLGACAVVPLLALGVFHPASTFTTLWCIVFALGLGLAAWKLPARWRAFLQIFLGLEAGLNAFRDLMTLIFISGSGAHIHTDAESMSNALFLPPLFWAISWTAVSVAILAAAVLMVLRRDMTQLRG